MNQELINICEKINFTLKNTEEYKKMKIAENYMENSEEVQLLSYKKDQAIMFYEDSLKDFKKNTKESLLKEKEMSMAIYNLNNHKLVKEYNEARKAYLEILNYINDEVFNKFKC